MEIANPASPENRKKVLDTIPQQPPFRFIDNILELTDTRIVSEYYLKESEFFYQGHFPGNPVTPGVIMIEMMAQTSVVALGIYLLLLEGRDLENLTFFTECEVEFRSIVPPNTKVKIIGEKVFYRRNKLRSKASAILEDGTVAAQGEMAGMEVPY